MHRQGFTIIELALGITITFLILSLGVFFSFDFYRSYALISEKEAILGALRNARSRSIHNIHQARHGVQFEADPALSYTFIECAANDTSCNESAIRGARISALFEVSFIAPSPLLPFNIMFDQLSGNCSTCQNQVIIRISNEKKYYDITVTEEGRIDG